MGHLVRTMVKGSLLGPLPLFLVDLADVHDGVQRPFPLGDLGAPHARHLRKPVTCTHTQEA